MNKKAVIFDFDGTLADTLNPIIDLVNQHGSEYGISQLTDKDIDEIRGMTYRELAEKFHIPWVKLPFIVLRLQQEINKVMDRVKPFAGIKNLLVGLHDKNVRLGILTSNSTDNVYKFLKTNGLEKYFDFVHSELNLFGKDKALLHLLKKYSLKKEEIFYVGDEVRDIDACQKAGVDIISVGWGFNKRELLEAAKPTYLVGRPEEILKKVLSSKY